MNNYYEELLKATNEEERSLMIYKISKNTIRDVTTLLKKDKIDVIMMAEKIVSIEKIIKDMKVEKKRMEKLNRILMTLYDLSLQKCISNNIDLQILMLMRQIDGKIRELSKEEYNRLFSRKV
jgi:hypothetical protein